MLLTCYLIYRVTCIALTEDFLFYGTEAGSVEVFSLSEWELLSGAELRYSIFINIILLELLILELYIYLISYVYIDNILINLRILCDWNNVIHNMIWDVMNLG